MKSEFISILLCLIVSALTFQGCSSITVRPEVDPVLAEKEAAIQKELSVQQHVQAFQRLSRVSTPILVNGASLCDDVTYFIGMDTNSLDAIPEEWREAYESVLDLEKRVKITYVIEGTPAHEAGLKQGDVILMMNGQKIEPGKNCYKTFFEELTELLDSGQVISFWIEREGVPSLYQVTPEKRCDYPVIMTDDPIVNAYADGESVMVTKGMMDFAAKDEELALVIGHELGHNVMGHIEKKTGSRIMGAILDGLLAGVTGVQTNVFTNAAGMMYSQEYEQEADYVGMYFMERGGYESNSAPMFWRRMGASFPYAISHATTHPTSASRYVFLEKCAEEIQAKRDAGKELLPEYKEKNVVRK